MGIENMCEICTFGTLLCIKFVAIWDGYLPSIEHITNNDNAAIALT